MAGLVPDDFPFSSKAELDGLLREVEQCLHTLPVSAGEELNLALGAFDRLRSAVNATPLVDRELATGTVSHARIHGYYREGV